MTVGENQDECARLREEIEDHAAISDALAGNVKSLEDECYQLQSQLDYLPEAYEALETVKYWLHDALVLGKPLSDPAVILRKVEEALE